MADKEIPELTAAAPLDGSEVIHVVQGGNSRQATVADVGGANTLDDLSDVDAYEPADGDILVWDSSAQAWVNTPNDGGSSGGASVSSQSGTSYTAVLADANTYIRFTNGSAISFTIPPNSSEAFPVGTVIEVEQAGAGALSFVAGSGVTLNSRASDLTLAGQYAVAFAKKVATDTWTINGDL